MQFLELKLPDAGSNRCHRISVNASAMKAEGQRQSARQLLLLRAEGQDRNAPISGTAVSIEMDGNAFIRALPQIRNRTSPAKAMPTMRR